MKINDLLCWPLTRNYQPDTLRKRIRLALSYCSMNDLKREKKICKWNIARTLNTIEYPPNKPLINHHCLLIRQTLINNCDFLHTGNGLLKMIPSEKKRTKCILSKIKKVLENSLNFTNKWEVTWSHNCIQYCGQNLDKKNNKYVTIFELEEKKKPFTDFNLMGDLKSLTSASIHYGCLYDWFTQQWGTVWRRKVSCGDHKKLMIFFAIFQLSPFFFAVQKAYNDSFFLFFSSKWS